LYPYRILFPSVWGSCEVCLHPHGSLVTLLLHFCISFISLLPQRVLLSHGICGSPSSNPCSSLLYITHHHTALTNRYQVLILMHNAMHSVVLGETLSKSSILSLCHQDQILYIYQLPRRISHNYDKQQRT